MQVSWDHFNDCDYRVTHVDRAFELAFNPPQDRFVLGARLAPLTVGHALLLNRVNSPFILGGQYGISEFLQAVFICAHKSHEEAEKDLDKWWTPAVLKFWAWKGRRKKFDLAKEADKFRSYLDDSLCVARTKRNLSNGTAREAQSPWIFRLLVWLIKDLHFDFEAAQTLPVVLANALCVTAAEASGALNLWEEREQSLWEFAREMDAKKFPASATSTN